MKNTNVNQSVQLTVAAYQLLLRFYPRHFQEEYGAEMTAVFAATAKETAASGSGALPGLFWRELRDWPGHCLREHWRARERRITYEQNEVVSQRDMVAAVLPHLLFIVVYLVATVFNFSLSPTIGMLATYGFLVMIPLALLIAWWRRWPAWSGSWWGYLFLLLFTFAPSFLLSAEYNWNTWGRLAWTMATEVLLPQSLSGSANASTLR